MHSLPPDKAGRLMESITAVLEVINRRRLGMGRRLDHILTIILDYLGVEHGSIMLREGRDKLVVRAASRKELIGVAQSLDQASIAAAVARSGEVIYVPDISADPRFQQRDTGGLYRSKSVLSVPIRQNGRVAGVINVTDKLGGRDLLQEDSSYLLRFTSLILSLVIQENMTAEIRRQRNALEKRARELQRRQAMQADLSRMLVHDLKGPLSEVIANLDILSYSVNDDQKIFLNAAQIACDRAVRMAADLGTVAKIEDGSLRLALEDIEPAALVEEAIISVSGIARSKGIELQQETAADLPVVRMDRMLIDRVLQNLLINALGHAPESSSITTGCRYYEKKKAVEFFVTDQGPGIREEDQRRIFEKYARLSRRHDSLVGSGLGLYFCRLAVEAHRGRIGVDSAPGRGSRFFFSLPV